MTTFWQALVGRSDAPVPSVPTVQLQPTFLSQYCRKVAYLRSLAESRVGQFNSQQGGGKLKNFKHFLTTPKFKRYGF